MSDTPVRPAFFYGDGQGESVKIVRPKVTITERLQRDLDELLEARAHYVRQYDRSRDGTEEKRDALAALDRLGPQIVRLEAKLSDAADREEFG